MKVKLHKSPEAMPLTELLPFPATRSALSETLEL
jgi:hypothetical protein